MKDLVEKLVVNEAILQKEKDLQQSSPFGFFSVFKEPLSQRLTSSDGGRRLLVRKDILVSK